MSGWISIHRKIYEHWIWKEKPFDKRSAWIDLLMMVNHEDKKILLGNELVEVKRGSRITSIRQLCDRWGWSNTKVINFLKLLQEDEMIAFKSDTKKTSITIVNYNDYQILKDSENDTKTTEERHESDTKTTREHTNNNDNNENNDNKNIYILSEDESKFLKVLELIPNYPLNRDKDLEMYKTLEVRYPTLNLIEAIEQWRIYKLDQPLKAKSNPRSQINTAFKKYIEWGKCLKKGGINDGQCRTSSQGASEETLRLERIAKEQGFIRADGTIEEPGEVDF